MSKYTHCDFADYCCGFQFQVLCESFSPLQIPKKVKLSMGKIQLNVELTF